MDIPVLRYCIRTAQIGDEIVAPLNLVFGAWYRDVAGSTHNSFCIKSEIVQSLKQLDQHASIPSTEPPYKNRLRIISECITNGIDTHLCMKRLSARVANIAHNNKLDGLSSTKNISYHSLSFKLNYFNGPYLNINIALFSFYRKLSTYLIYQQ